MPFPKSMNAPEILQKHLNTTNSITRSKEEVLNNETASRLRYLQTSLATERWSKKPHWNGKNKELAEANAEIQRQMAILDEQATEIEVSNAVLEEKNLVITQLP